MQTGNNRVAIRHSIPTTLSLMLLCLVLASSSWQALALGVPNVAQTAGAMLSGPNAPEMGRTPVIAYHGGMLFTFPEQPGSPPGDYQVRVWNIADPSAPVVTDTIGYTRHGFMAHGFIKRGDILNSGYTLSVSPSGAVTVEPDMSFRMLGWTHGGMSVPWGITNYWSYGDTSAPAELHLDRVWNTTPEAVFTPVADTGVIGHPFIFGTTLYYASDQSLSGIASYDISDPSNPVLLDVLREGSIGGYWPDPVGVNGRLYFFFPRDNPSGGFSVVDGTDPTDLRLVADVPLTGRLNYAQFQDEFAFSERYKIDMRNFDVVLRLDVDADHRSGERVDTSQFSLPIGNLLVTGGNFTGGECQVPGFASNHCGTGMSIWAHQSAPDTRGPFVAFHAPADGQTNYPAAYPIQVLIHETLRSETINSSTVRLRPVNNGVLGDDVASELWFSSNDILSIVPLQPLASNTTYRVDLVENGIEDAVGNGMQAYSFEFSTGDAIASGNNRPTVESIALSSNPVRPGSSATVSVTALDADGDALEFRYDFGDGTTPLEYTSESSVTHTYYEAGHYTLSVQVRDPSGSVSSRTFGVTVVETIEDNSGTASGHLAADGQGLLWVVNPDNDSVSVVDLASGERVNEFKTCADPRSVAIDSAQRAWISCHDADKVQVLSADGKMLQEFAMGYGSAPIATVSNASGAKLLVTLYGSGELVLFDTIQMRELDRIALGATAKSIAWSADGSRALVTRFISPSTHGEVWDVDVASDVLSLSGVISLAHQWGEDLRFDGRGVPNYLSAIRITPDGSRAWVAAKKDNINRGLYMSGEDLDQDNTVRSMIAQIDLASATELITLRRDLDNSEQPSAIEFSAYGDYAFVALQGSNAVLVIDALKIDAGFSGVSSVAARVGVGAAPQDLQLVGNTLWVHAFLSRQVDRLDLSAFLGRGALDFAPVSTVLTQSEKLAPNVLRGKQVFYHAADPRMSGEGYMSCASCHIDGGLDGQTFDFSGRGEGMRNTPTLQGRAGLAHGLVHWSANFDEIQDFEIDIRGPFGGSGFMSDEDFALRSNPLGQAAAGVSVDLDHLAAYVSSLGTATVPRSPYRSADGAMTAAALRGANHFDALGCADCHSGRHLVTSEDQDLALRDVGTVGTRSGNRLGASLAGIDVPTLHGLWASAPYLHSGEAPDLASVFGATGKISLQAEEADQRGGTELRNATHWSVDRLAAFRGGEFVNFNSGGRVGFTLPQMTPGLVSLTFRYHANYQPARVRLVVDGVTEDVVLPVTLAGDWRLRNWSTYTHSLTVGAQSELLIEFVQGVSFALDEIAIGDIESDIEAATPHRAALDLEADEFDDLMAYLLQLDGRPASAMQVQIEPQSVLVSGGVLHVDGVGSGANSGRVEVALGLGEFRAAEGVSNWTAQLPIASDAPSEQLLTVRLFDGDSGVWVESQMMVEIGELPPLAVPAVSFVWLIFAAYLLLLVAARESSRAS